MRFSVAYLILLCCLWMTACGSDKANTADTSPEEVPSVAPAFEPAATALANGEGPARVGGLLMQRFNAVSDPASGALDLAASESFVDLSIELADKFPGDTLAALPLYRAAEVVRAMNDPKKAATIYERVHRDYPTFSKAPESLFMLAFTYDEDLNNLERAKATYEEFLARYPNNTFADDTRMLLDNLGKSDEEILRDLEEKAKTQQ